MISGKDIYQVVSALVPLYAAMILAYGSVRWWKVFTPDQCAGINRFVAVFATPFLVFDFICSNNPYKMNLRFIAADSLQKVVVLVVLFIWQATTRRGELDWTITLFSLSTLPNTLVVGVPLLKSIAAKRLVAGQFPETAASISSFKVDPAVVSLGGHEPLETDAEIDDDGKLRVVVRRSSATSSNFSSRDRFDGWNPVLSVHLPPRASNFSSVEVFSVQSSPRASSYRQTDLPNLTSSFGDIYSLQSSRNSVPRISSNLEEEMRRKNGVAFPGSPSCAVPQKEGGGAPPPNKDLHMFVWSSSISSNISDHRYLRADQINGRHTYPDHPFNGAAPQQDNIAAAASTAKKQQMPPATVVARLIAMMVGRKLVRNPNTYASLLGLLWSLISFRWSIKLPLIVDGSVRILSNAGLGMAMFSLGLFAALQPNVIASGKVLALISMAIKFLIGPAVIAAASLAIGLRGDLLSVAIVQAALPSGILPFIFAKEYNLHANIQSTS
uniref:Auxin efflux carrier component n=1 Tax=Populus alba TaxID=43335 RepID=A0A4U5MZD9_POPAL|nr:putative auxin efflux carrier protein 10 [Populus alba]